MQATPPQPNTAFGAYHLVRLLARGGMGHVFLAQRRDVRGAKGRVVVKVLQEELSGQAEMRSMFLHEARLGSLLQHPCIAQIHDYGEHDGVLYLAMEYVDGLALSAIMRRLRGKVPLGAALRIVADVASALVYAHEAKGPTGEALHIVHRDVTPQNVLISGRGHVKLIDFGVAKSTGQDHRTRTGVLKGKLSYMAPEQFRGNTTHQTDVFALGVVLHELVSGKRLFRRETEAETFAAILTEPLPPLRTTPEAARVLQPIVERALARELEDRYPDARAFEADLRKAMTDLRLDCSALELARLAAVPKRSATASEPPRDPSAPESASGMRFRIEGEESEPSPASWPSQPSGAQEEWRSDSGFSEGQSATGARDVGTAPPHGPEPGVAPPPQPASGWDESDEADTIFDASRAQTTAHLWSAAGTAPAPDAETPALEPTPMPKGASRRGWLMALGVGLIAAIVAFMVVGGPEGDTAVVEGPTPPPAVGVTGQTGTPSAGVEEGASLPDTDEPILLGEPERQATPAADDTTEDGDTTAGADTTEGADTTALQDPDGHAEAGAASSDDGVREGEERSTRRAARRERLARRAAQRSSAESSPPTKSRREAESARSPARRAEAAPAAPGQLFLDSDPWTFVRLGGRSLGQTPIVNVELPAGRHVLELREADGTTHRVPVRISSGQPTKRFLRLGD